MRVRFKNIFTVLLFSLFFFGACAPVNDSGSAADSPAGTVMLYDGKNYGLSVVVGENAGADCLSAAELLCSFITDTTGDERLICYEDFEEPPSNGRREIVVGAVDRDASRRALAETGDDFKFIIEVDGDGIAIVGSTDKYTLSGVRYFIDTYLEERLVFAGDAVFIECGKYVSERFVPSLGEYARFCAERGRDLNCTYEKSLSLPPVDGYYVPQGGYIDENGKYLYLAMYRPNVSKSSILLKYETATGAVVAKNKAPSADHANDICYVPQEDAIAVAHNAPNRTLVSFYRASDLAYMRTEDVGFPVCSLSYNKARGVYVAGISGATDDFMILDRNLKPVKRFEIPPVGGTHQGMDCDDDYLYFVQSDTDGKNILAVYDWSGNLIAVNPLASVGGETEFITHADNAFYLGVYRGSSVSGGETYKIGYTL